MNNPEQENIIQPEIHEVVMTKEKCLEEIGNLKSALEKLEQEINSSGKFASKIAHEGGGRDEAHRAQLVKRIIQVRTTIATFLGIPDDAPYESFIG